MNQDSTFDVSLRFMDREVFGFGLKTSTTRQSWAVIGILSMFAVAALFSSLQPILEEIVR